MKIVIIGGTGNIGSKLTAKLRARGHEVVAAAPSTGVNAVTGEGLAPAFKDAQVVVDVANSPSFEPDAAMAFFQSAGKNLAAAEKQAGVKHHVALSVVGTDRLQASGYFRAKLAQENAIKSAGVSFTIVRACQFFEFIGAVAQDATVGNTVRARTSLMQPMAADDVAEALADVAISAPVNGIAEIGGPEPMQIDDAIRRLLVAKGDPREVIADDNAMYFGLKLERGSLVPGPGARLGRVTFAEWLRHNVPSPHAMAG
ncbi:MAG TPA: NAD(P)H-binding protein [Phycisphaerales bacterium]|nr:NAD(P)H-binding protein [Phycisphaerales bacterium]